MDQKNLIHEVVKGNDHPRMVVIIMVVVVVVEKLVVVKKEENVQNKAAAAVTMKIKSIVIESSLNHHYQNLGE